MNPVRRLNEIKTPPGIQKKSLVFFLLLTLLTLPLLILSLQQTQTYFSRADEDSTCATIEQNGSFGVENQEKKRNDIDQLRKINQDFHVVVNKYKENRNEENKEQLIAFAQRRKELLILTMIHSPEVSLSIIQSD